MAKMRFIVGCSLATAALGILGNEIVQDCRHTETGTVITKSDYEIFVDTDGDNKADRLVDVSPCFERGTACYNYAKPGNKITYTNTFGKDTIYVFGGPDRIKKVDGKSIRQIEKQYKLNRLADMSDRCR